MRSPDPNAAATPGPGPAAALEDRDLWSVLPPRRTLVLALLVGAALRVVLILVKPLWAAEIFTRTLARTGVSAIVDAWTDGNGADSYRNSLFRMADSVVINSTLHDIRQRVTPFNENTTGPPKTALGRLETMRDNPP